MLQNIIKGFEYGFVGLVLDSYTNPPVYIFTAFTGKVSLLVYKFSSFFVILFLCLRRLRFSAKYLENARAHIFISSCLFAETVLGRFLCAGKTPSC